MIINIAISIVFSSLKEYNIGIAYYKELIWERENTI